MKGVFAFDIDGTLTHRLDWIDPKVIQALENLIAEDWKVALLTGRIFSFAWQILQLLPFSYFLAVQNGADLLTMPGKQHIAQNYLTPEILPQIEKAYEGQAEDFIIYAGIDQGDFCYFRPERFSPKVLEYLKKLESLASAPWRSSDFSFEERTTFSLIKCFGDEASMHNLYEKIKKNPKVEVSMVHDPIDPSLYLNLITHPKANKGSVVHFLREHFQSRVVIAAGDDGNDLKMLKEADVSIAIETAPEEVVAIADVKARPAEKLGIIPAIEEALALVR